MAVLVTGATGFLGAHLALALCDQGVIATGRDRAKLARLKALGLRSVALDLAHPVPAADRDRIGAVDAVVHCAALSSPWGRDAAFETANVTATKNLLHLSRALRARRFVFVSTASVYFQFCDQDGLGEAQTAPKFVNAYARTKYAAEREVLKFNDLHPIVLRPRGIYGAGDTALLPRLMRVARSRAVPRFSPAGATDITHVDDVVSACQRAIAADPVVSGEVFNISGGQGVALPDIVAAACAQCDVPLRWRDLPFGPALAAVRVMERMAKTLPGQPEPPATAYALGILRYRQTMSLAHAQTALGWQPQVNFEEGLRRTFANGAMRQGVL
ncbi:NAD-dependent epimerase/dehydratase family protein [Loktanella sp. Alg231-35]|uniref:NAD-dependent epimerase/dehydratase family protein n=1 Tax=Loktanella sp. Alg231-35 TaxID=1922220 RepID=UPI000D55C28B|nr:NAD(P)-dependent oxidoreductase [Loktanella sp. Alg231-35]